MSLLKKTNEIFFRDRRECKEMIETEAEESFLVSFASGEGLLNTGRVG